MTPFHPVVPRSGTLSGAQKYLLRVVLGLAGKTIFHRGRLVEVTDTHATLRQLYPLMESNLSESKGAAFWIPRTFPASKKFEADQRKREAEETRLRKYPTIGVVWGEPRPKYARRHNLRSRFPSPSYLRYLVAELGYDPHAAWAAFARPQGFSVRPDRRRKTASPSADEQAERMTAGEQRKRAASKGYQRLDYGDNLYVPNAPIRRTMRGGGFNEKQVRQGLSRMRTDNKMKMALFDVVDKRLSPQVVAAKYRFSRAKLDVYASRLRERIRKQNAGVDLHVQENLPLYSQRLTYPSVKNLDIGWKGEQSYDNA